MRLTYSMADQDFARTKSLGIFNVALGLAERLASRQEFSRFTVLANHTLANHLQLVPAAQVQPHDEAIAGRLRRALWDQLGVYRAAARAGNEWLCLPKGFASFVARCPVKLVTYVHDTIHDFYRERYPGLMSSLESAYFFRGLLASIRHSTVIFTNSEFTRSEILRLASMHRLAAPEVVRIGIGFTRPVRRSPGKDDRLLVLTTRWPHKRADLAMDYLAKWHAASGYQGTIDWLGSLPSKLTLPDRPGWRLHARVSQEQFEKWLTRSRALIYFTEYEGFGMPPVEAMLAGTCPVYSEIPATTEVMRGLGCAFQQASYPSFASAMDRALGVSADVLEDWAGRLLQWHDWDVVADRFVRGLLDTESVTART
jgi:glycosyltransferase involved in cell wall biosynthesis